MSAKFLLHTANNGLLKTKPSQCLNRGIDFINKRATFSIEINFKPSVGSKELRLVYVSEMKYTVCYECTFFILYDPMIETDSLIKPWLPLF